MCGVVNITGVWTWKHSNIDASESPIQRVSARWKCVSKKSTDKTDKIWRSRCGRKRRRKTSKARRQHEVSFTGSEWWYCFVKFSRYITYLDQQWPLTCSTFFYFEWPLQNLCAKDPSKNLHFTFTSTSLQHTCWQLCICILQFVQFTITTKNLHTVLTKKRRGASSVDLFFLFTHFNSHYTL